MSRLRQTAITKTVKAVATAGQRIARVEVKPDGTVIIHTLDPAGDRAILSGGTGSDNEWDEVLQPAAASR